MTFQRHQVSAHIVPSQRTVDSCPDRSSGGRRRALCVGIDRYPEPGDRLTGCKNDAKHWKQALERRGFEVQLMVDEQATRAGLRDAIGSLIRKSRQGDVVAIQMSCHGTQLPDYRGDEDDQLDEAVVPYDHRSDGYLVDDDIAEVADQIPSGVNVTFFMDLCHSGSATRFAVGALDRHTSTAKVRFLPVDEQMLRVHQQTRSRSRGRSRNAYKDRPEVLFSACAPHQTAKERGGQGDFTRYALQVLRDADANMTNLEFLEKVVRVGQYEQQDPALWADDRRLNSVFLGGADAAANSGTGATNSTVEAIREVEQALSRLRTTLQ